MDKALRNQTLISINQELNAKNLRPIKKLGDADKGELEIIGIDGFLEHNQRFYTEVVFAVKNPDGVTFTYPVRFNRNGNISDGSVFVVQINDKFAIAKQWRISLGRWTYETIRGFSDKNIKEKLTTVSVADLPFDVLRRELGGDLVSAMEIKTIAYLGTFDENTSTHAVAPEFFYVELKADEVEVQKRLARKDEEVKLYLWNHTEVTAEIGGKLRDMHTMTAFLATYAHVSRQPKNEMF